MLDLLAAIIIGIVSLVFTLYIPGYFLSWVFFSDKLSSLDRHILSFALSVLLVGTIMTLYASFFISFTFLRILTPLLVVIFASLYLYYRKTKSFPPLPKCKLPKLSMPHILILIFVILSFYHALAFPATAWDELSYHLPYSQDFYELGYVPTEGPLFLQHPNSLHFLNSWFYMANGFNDFFARLMPPIFALAFILTLYSFTSKLFDKKTATYAALFMSAVPLFAAQSSITYLNIPEAFFGFLGIMFLYLAIKTKKSQNLYFLVSGLLIGFTAIIKYSGIIFVIAAFVTLLVCYRKKLNKIVVPVLILLIAIIIVAAPWYLRNYSTFGSPVYPYSMGIFPAPYGTQNEVGMIQQIERFIFDERISYSFGLGPLLLTFVLVGKLALGPKKQLKFFLLPYAIVMFIFILLLLRIDDRTFIPLLPVLAMLGAIGYLHLQKASQNYVRKLSALLAMFIILFGLSFAVIGFKMHSDYVDQGAKLGIPIPKDFDTALEERFGPLYGAWMYIKENSNKDEAVLAHFERSYYYDRPTYTFYLFQEAAPGVRLHLEGAVEIIKSKNIRYVLYENRTFHENVYAEINVIIYNLDNTQYFEKVFEDQWVSIYEVK